MPVSSRSRLLAVAVAAISMPVIAAAQTAAPTAVDMLFESKHLDTLPQNAEATYRLERTVSEAKLLGQPFSDDLRLKVNKVGDQGEREVVLSIFSGDRARDPQVLPDHTGNPLLVFYLDRAVNNFAMLGGGARPYLKDRFKAALRESATVEPAKFEYGGKSVEGYKISVTPFAADQSKNKMQGFENSRFSLTVSQQVPGFLYEMTSSFESTQPATPKLEERIKLVSVAGGTVAETGAQP